MGVHMLTRAPFLCVGLALGTFAVEPAFADPLGGALEGLGSMAAAKQLGDYMKGFSQALEELRARAIADANLGMSQRIDQLALAEKMIVDSINADASARIEDLNRDSRAALDEIRTTVQQISDKLETRAALDIDVQLTNFCSHSLLCSPTYTIRRVLHTVVNPANLPVKRISVLGTAFVSGATVHVTVNGQFLRDSVIDPVDGGVDISVPLEVIPQSNYGIRKYPISITVSGTVKEGFFHRRVTRQLASVDQALYVLPKFPLSVTVTQLVPSTQWENCPPPVRPTDDDPCHITNVGQLRATQRGSNPVWTASIDLPGDRSLGDVIDWPGRVGANDQTHKEAPRGDYYAYVCTRPREVDLGNYTRKIQSQCLDAILYNEKRPPPNNGCGPKVFGLINSGKQGDREEAVRLGGSCNKQPTPSNASRTDRFEYTLLKPRADARPEERSTPIKDLRPNADGTFDLTYGSYCSEQLASDGTFSIWVTPRLAQGPSTAKELTASMHSLRINDTAIVTASLENDPPRRCARVNVAEPDGF
jgi:hypothetical protein